MKKKYFRHFSFMLAGLVFLFSACTNLLNDKDSGDSGKAGRDESLAYITIDALGPRVAARDIQPSANDINTSNFTNISLSGVWNSTNKTLIPTKSSWADFANAIPTEGLAIQTGDWTFTISAQMNGVTFTGKIDEDKDGDNDTVSITAGETKNLSFVMTASGENCGGLALTVKISNFSEAIPSGTDVSVKVTLTNSSGVKAYEDTIAYPASDPSNTGITFSRDISDNDEKLPAGIYDMQLSVLADGLSDAVTERTEKVYIYAGIITTNTINLRVSPVYDIAYKYKDGELVPVGSGVPAKYTRKAANINLPAQTKTGYTFEGWFTDATAGTEITQISNSTINDLTPASTTTFYARFSPNTDTQYIVKHWKQKVNGNAATHNESNYELPDDSCTEISQGVTGEAVTISLKDTTTGDYYGFVEPTSDEQTEAQEITINPDGTTVVNLYYTRHYVSVNYRATINGSNVSGFPYSANVNWYGQTLQIYSKEPQAEGYNFIGWTRSQNPSPSDTYYKKGTANSSLLIESTEAIWFYAQFEPITNTFTVTFETNGGSPIESQTVQSGKYAQEPKDPPTKEAFNFADWFTDNTFKTKFDFAKTPITADTTIYACWTYASYAKVDGTYYANYVEAKAALSTLTEGEHTVTIYSIPANDLGSTTYPGSMIYAIMQSSATAVHFNIHEDAGIEFGANNDGTFKNGTKFVSIDISGLKNVTSMQAMFKGCENLQSVNFGDYFDTSAVRYMSEVFANCLSLTEVDISTFKTTSAETFEAMFYGCSSLTTIYASNYFTIPNSATNNDMFTNCTSLVGGNGSTFAALNITNGEAARIDGGPSSATPGYFTLKPSSGSVTLTFDSAGGSSVASQTLESGSTAIRPKSPSKTDYAFDDWYTDSACTTPFDFASPVTNNMTLYAKWVKRNDLYAKINNTYYSSIDDTMAALTNTLPKNGVKDITITLYSSKINASILGKRGTTDTLLDAISAVDGSDKDVYDSVTLIFDAGAGIVLGGDECTGRFTQCQTLVYVDLSGIVTQNLSSMGSMLKGCQKLETVIFGNGFDTSNVTNMADLFRYNTKLTHVEFGNFDTRKVEYMSEMFADCSSLTEIDISSFEPASATTVAGMFYRCTNLKTIYASSKFVVSNKATDTEMFADCTRLVGEKGTTYDSKNTGKEFAQLDGGPASATPGYFSKKTAQGLNCSVGDVILNDGTIIKYRKSYKLSEEEANAAIAIIFYDGSGSLGNRPLGLGLYENITQQMTNKVEGYSIMLNSSDDSGKVYTQAVYACSDYSKNASDYPAFNWLLQYFKAVDGALDSSVYKDDWYLPSKNELLEIYRTMEKINMSFEMINKQYIANINTDSGNVYGAAYQSSKDASKTGVVPFETGEWSDGAAKTLGIVVRAIHEF